MKNAKVKCIQFAIVLGIGMSKILYFFFKLFPTQKEKVLFCSRQSNNIPFDFLLLQKEICSCQPDVKFVTICDHVEHNLKGCVLFLMQLLRSMYHLATSSVCVVDSYWPTVSILKHKKNLRIIQIWHSIGKVKKSGYQILGKKSGRDANYASMLGMHKNYDYVIAGAPIWNKYYCEAFNITEDKLLNWGLPRIDYLLDTVNSNREKFFSENPELKNKKIVLYAPTFRKNMKSCWNGIFKAKAYEDIVIIVKNHPGQSAKRLEANAHIRYFDEWETMDLIAVCDYLITDYSSIALEAAVLNKKTFYWTYDYNEYMENSGINFNLRGELSEHVFEEINDIMHCIENNIYNMQLQKSYRKKYLPQELGNSTSRIAELIIELMEETAEQKVFNDEIRNNGRWKRKQMGELFGYTQTLGGDKRRTANSSNRASSEYDDPERFRDCSNVS